MIIPPNRLALWNGNVGVPGGIPNRTTIWKNIVTDLGADPTGQVNAGPIILNAIQTCPANQVVFMPAGTFLMTSSVSTFLKNNFTLRGAGQDVTTLRLVGSPSFYFRGNLPFPPREVWQAVTSGGTTGTNSITVANPVPFEVGSVMQIGTIPVPLWCKNLGGFPDTDPSFYVSFKVRTVVGNTITFDPPIPYDMTALGQPLMANCLGGNLVTGVGVESFTADVSNCTAPFPIELEYAWGSWIYDCKVWEAVSRQMFVTNCLRCEVRRCYTHTSVAAGPNHEGITLSGSWHLVSDNICDRGGAMAIIFADGGRGVSCNVASYNYIINTEGGWWDMSFCHGQGSNYNLAEGNMMHWFKDDGYFGSCTSTTLLRNRIDWSTQCKHFSNYYNIVGNVLGGSDPVMNYESTLNGPFESSIYQLGYPNIGNQNWTVDLAAQSPTPDYHLFGNTLDQCQFRDGNVKATMIRHGNWDSVHNDVIWDASIPDHVIPNSYYLDQKPDWWGNLPWPSIGPDLNPMTGTIPAKERYSPTIPPTGKVISLTGTGLVFGDVPIGQHPTGNLAIKNIGDQTLTVSSITYPTGFTGTTTGFTVAPGVTVNRTVTFNPIAVQTYSGNIVVNSDATAGANTMPVSGNGISVSTGKIISLSGVGLDFGTVQIGNSANGTLTVSNIGDTLLTVSSVTYPTCFSGVTTGFTVAAGAHRDITVTFTPMAELDYTANITVASDANAGSGVIQVTGVGVAAPPPPGPHGHRKQPRDSFGF